MNYFNTPLTAAILSWCLAQLIKTVAFAIKHRTFLPERIFGAGGMPSSHSATVCSLMIVISRNEGVASAEFAISLVLALIVMYDAIGIRQAAGNHAREINRLRRIIAEYHIKQSGNHEKNINISKQIDLENEEYQDEQLLLESLSDNLPDDKEKDLKEFLGHTPIEVIFGALLGILVGMLFSL